MRQSARYTMTAAILAASLLVIACGGNEPANEAAANESESNVMLDQIGNDASALEAAGAATPIDAMDEGEANFSVPDPSGSGTQPPSAPAQAGRASEPVLGETSGGDTGGNTVQGNVSGQ